MMVKFLGYLNIALFASLLSLFVLRRLNRQFFQNRNLAMKKAAAHLSKAHPYLGGLLLASAGVHGYMGLGQIPQIFKCFIDILNKKISP